MSVWMILKWEGIDVGNVTIAGVNSSRKWDEKESKTKISLPFNRMGNSVVEYKC